MDAQAERRRIVGYLLAQVGTARLRGDVVYAEWLDALALEVEKLGFSQVGRGASKPPSRCGR